MSVLPPVSPVPPEASAVGGHFRLDEFHLSVAAAMGVKWTRIHDCEDFTHWNTAEPEKGRFVWFDDKVRLARQHRVKLLGEFLRVPRWASSAGQDVTGDSVHRKPPRDLNEFAAYVRAVVEHYKDDYWCVWEDTLLPRTSGMTVFEYDGSLRPMAVSYAVAASLLDGTRGEGWIELPGPALANLLRDERRMIAVLWRQGGRRQRRFVVPLNPSTLGTCGAIR
jgi:hypothetical protein